MFRLNLLIFRLFLRNPLISQKIYSCKRAEQEQTGYPTFANTVRAVRKFYYPIGNSTTNIAPLPTPSLNTEMRP